MVWDADGADWGCGMGWDGMGWDDLLLALLVWLAGLCDDPAPGMLMPESVW